MTAKPHHREVIAFLREAGAEKVRIEHGGKRPRAVFLWQGKERWSTLSGTPGTGHAAEVAIRELRRMLGLAKTEKTGGARRRRKTRAADAPAKCPRITALPDYRDDLLLAKYRGLDARELDCALWHACRALLREHIARLGA